MHNNSNSHSHHPVHRLIQKTISKLLIMFVILLSVSFAQALVDMRNSGFTRTWTDYASSDAPLLTIHRSYRSRSLFIGFFGFGWCSNYEDALDLSELNKGLITFKECGDGAGITYRKGKNKAHRSSNILTSFYTIGGAGGKLVQVRNGYLRHLANGHKQTFDQDGRFVRFENKNGKSITLQYDEKKCLSKVIDSQGKYLDFVCDKKSSQPKIKKITTYDGKTLLYNFHRLEDLIWVKLNKKKIFGYKYDSLHNMIRGTYQGGKKFRATYNEKRDWILSFTNEDGCIEKYTYEVSRSNPHARHRNKVKKYCKNKLVVTKEYSFWYKTRKDGEIYLSRMLIKIDDNLDSDTHYHSRFGLPISVQKLGRLVTYTYFSNGLVKIKKEGSNEVHFSYSKKTAQITHVEHFIVSKKGKKRKHYWARAQLVQGKRKRFFDSKGFDIKIKHDDKDRIVRIEDQANRVVYIEYDKISLRPKKLSSPHFGSLTISYRPNGQVNNIETRSKGKDRLIVTTQIIQTFNQFLRLVNYLDVEKIYI